MTSDVESTRTAGREANAAAGPEPRLDVVVTYLAALPADEPAARRAADAFALGQSLGTWQPVPGITDEMRRTHGAQVLDLRRGLDGEAVGGASAAGRWVLRVAFPLANLGDSLAMLLTTAIGNDPSTSIAMRVVELDLPPAFSRIFPGPRFGIAGWREMTDVVGRPLLLNMIKPCTGFPPEVGAGFAAASARGGVDLIKDDELLADPAFSRVAERTRAYVAAIDRVAAETGRRTRYVAHVTSRPSRLLAIARSAVDEGAAAVMITPVTLGLDALGELAEGVGVPILAHVAGLEAVTGSPEGGIGHGALAALLRTAGADAVLTSSPHAPRPLPAAAYRSTLDALSEPIAGGAIHTSTPVIGGGVTAEHVRPIVDEAGFDVIVASGGAIQGHPDGTAAGGRAMQAAIAAAVDAVTAPMSPPGTPTVAQDRSG
jgi:2,3-diketo-5-methylthiopentyl-1-phosphate enolase